MRRASRGASAATTRSSRSGIRSAAASRAALRDSGQPARARHRQALPTTRMQLLARRSRLPSLVDAKIDVSNASPEIHVAVDRARAADLGVRMSTVGNTLRLMVAGDDEISTYREGGEQYPVKIRVLESQRRDIEAIGKLTVAVGDGRAGSHRQHRAASSAASDRPRCRASTGSSRSISQADVAPGPRARRGVERRAPADRRA